MMNIEDWSNGRNGKNQQPLTGHWQVFPELAVAGFYRSTKVEAIHAYDDFNLNDLFASSVSKRTRTPKHLSLLLL